MKQSLIPMWQLEIQTKSLQTHPVISWSDKCLALNTLEINISVFHLDARQTLKGTVVALETPAVDFSLRYL